LAGFPGSELLRSPVPLGQYLPFPLRAGRVDKHDRMAGGRPARFQQDCSVQQNRQTTALAMLFDLLFDALIDPGMNDLFQEFASLLEFLLRSKHLTGQQGPVDLIVGREDVISKSLSDPTLDRVVFQSLVTQLVSIDQTDMAASLESAGNRALP
jgi:hypothetical protein